MDDAHQASGPVACLVLTKARFDELLADLKFRQWASASPAVAEDKGAATAVTIRSQLKQVPSASNDLTSRYCKKCKVIFTSKTCPGGHPNFVYTKNMPVGATKASPASKSVGDLPPDRPNVNARIYQKDTRELRGGMPEPAKSALQHQSQNVAETHTQAPPEPLAAPVGSSEDPKAFKTNSYPCDVVESQSSNMLSNDHGATTTKMHQSATRTHSSSTAKEKTSSMAALCDDNPSDSSETAEKPTGTIDVDPQFTEKEGDKMLEATTSHSGYTSTVPVAEARKSSGAVELGTRLRSEKAEQRSKAAASQKVTEEAQWASEQPHRRREGFQAAARVDAERRRVEVARIARDNELAGWAAQPLKIESTPPAPALLPQTDDRLRNDGGAGSRRLVSFSFALLGQPTSSEETGVDAEAKAEAELVLHVRRLMSLLARHRPQDPVTFIVDYCEKRGQISESVGKVSARFGSGTFAQYLTVHGIYKLLELALESCLTATPPHEVPLEAMGEYISTQHRSRLAAR
eukprot:SAG31_NODE_717_length_12611_cov_25.933104_5_plen_518_part_00